MKVNVLGTEYQIKKTESKEYDGYCDWTAQKIFIEDFRQEEDSLEDLKRYEKVVLRHELIHAFLHESGLAQNSDWATNEEMVDYFAKQLPKMLKVFKEVGCDE